MSEHDQKTIDAVVDLQRKYGDENWTFELREGIFDLILAAKFEEREACAKIAKGFPDLALYDAIRARKS